MKTVIIDEGRELTHEECVEIAKAHGIETVLMVQHTDGSLVGETKTEYKVTGW
jgi:hypothetical protein